MKAILAALLFAVAGIAGAQTPDLGPLSAGVPLTFTENGQWVDTAEVATTVDGAALSVQLDGGVTWRCSGGRGGGNCAYETSDVTSVTVTDAAGNVVCASSTRVVVGGGGGYQKWRVSCSAVAVPAGTYTVTLAGNAIWHTKTPNSTVAKDEPYSTTAQFQ